MVYRMEVIYNGSDKDYESSDEKAQQAWTGECRNRETARQRLAFSNEWETACRDGEISTSYSAIWEFTLTNPDVIVERQTKAVLLKFILIIFHLNKVCFTKSYQDT